MTQQPCPIVPLKLPSGVAVYTVIEELWLWVLIEQPVSYSPGRKQAKESRDGRDMLIRQRHIQSRYTRNTTSRRIARTSSNCALHPPVSSAVYHALQALHMQTTQHKA